MAVLQISTTDYHRILTAVGYPIIKEDDLGLSTDQIKDLLILPALKNVYFKWFPIRELQEVAAGSTFEIDFPDVNTFGVLDARLVWKKYNSNVSSGSNPFVYGMNVTVRSSGSPGRNSNMWDTGNDYGYSRVYDAEQAELQARLSSNKSLRINVDYENNKVKGYTNVAGNIVIIWAKYSDNFSAVQHRFKEDVIKLSQAYILRYFGDLFNQGSAALPDELDGTSFSDRGDELYEEVLEKWRTYTKPVLLRE